MIVLYELQTQLKNSSSIKKNNSWKYKIARNDGFSKKPAFSKFLRNKNLKCIEMQKNTWVGNTDSEMQKINKQKMKNEQNQKKKKNDKYNSPRHKI